MIINLLFILLGCNNPVILNNRVETATNYIKNLTMINMIDSEGTMEQTLTKIKLTWFLSGGIKKAGNGVKTEAYMMKSQINNIGGLKKNIEFDYVLDEKSSNTAENFFWASHYLNTTNKHFDIIYVITSKFHHYRASMMLNLIDPSRNYKWILGDLEERDSKYWETIHIKNVISDVSKTKVIMESL